MRIETLVVGLLAVAAVAVVASKSSAATPPKPPAPPPPAPPPVAPGRSTIEPVPAPPDGPPPVPGAIWHPNPDGKTGYWTDPNAPTNRLGLALPHLYRVTIQPGTPILTPELRQALGTQIGALLPAGCSVKLEPGVDPYLATWVLDCPVPIDAALAAAGWKVGQEFTYAGARVRVDPL